MLNLEEIPLFKIARTFIKFPNLWHYWILSKLMAYGKYGIVLIVWPIFNPKPH